MKTKHDDSEFISDVHASVISMVPFTAHLMLFACILCLTIAILWAHFAQLDQLTRGMGKVISSKNIQVVQNLEGGIIKDILVQEGDAVEKDQVLMIIDDTQHLSSVKEANLKKEDLKAKMVRLVAESEGSDLIFPEELKQAAAASITSESELYDSRKKEHEVKRNILVQEKESKKQELIELQGKQAQLKTNLDLVGKELAMTKPLLKEGIVSEVEVLRLERSFNDTKGELDSTNLAVPRMEGAVDSAQKRIDELDITFKKDAVAELNQVSAQLAQLAESSTTLEDRLRRSMVRSPVKGIVNQIKITTIGGIVQPAADLIEIVPLDDQLLIEARIKPQDVGLLRVGLPASVKITAYDYSIYGGLEGTLEHIGADTITDPKGEVYYEIKVRTQKNFLEKSGKHYDISPGMQASVDIKTGKKSVLSYLLKPILKTKQVALTEK